ncbi:TonB-dependent receptor plug domain-containing protein, partial [Rubrivirga sp.]|uniref:TonB-dependent receptor plug domain-containing protein n=1 Tax=Rubrivirga sp. TaxID=1885344 RepID=UPI003C76F3CD
MKRLALLLALAAPAFGQVKPDSTLERVVVTATRTAAALEDVAVPITVVGADEIEADGALRLGDVLDALPGLEVTSGLGGVGIQIQGLDPAYTLILIDGQPVVGRTAGVLDVSRLSTTGIERVEVVRGPSSSLYGSDALAGVVNLVTAVPREPAVRLRARTGSFAQSALALEAEGGTQLLGRAWGARLALDRTATDGYDLDPDLFGNTTPERTETTADLRVSGELGPQTRARLGVRATTGDDRLRYAFADVNDAVFPINETGARRDWSVHPELRHTWGGRYALRLQGYATGYRLDTQVFETDRGGGDSLTYDDRFDQRQLKAEAQVDALW